MSTSDESGPLPDQVSRGELTGVTSTRYPPDMQALTHEEIDRLHSLEAIERVKTTGHLIEDYRQAMATLASIRSEAVEELRSTGMSLGELAKHLHVTRQQVHRLGRAARARS